MYSSPKPNVPEAVITGFFNSKLPMLIFNLSILVVILRVLPYYFFALKYRSFGTCASVSACGLLNTAKTSSYAASHFVFQGYETLYTPFFATFCHSLHHRSWSASINCIKTLSKHTVFGYKSLFSHAAVLS